MELDEIVKSSDLRSILSDMEQEKIDKNQLMKNKGFKDKIYTEFEKNGISYDIMRELIKNVGEKSCIENLDIDKIMLSSKNNINIFFTTLMENKTDDLINEVINNEKYFKYFFENLDKNYSAINFCSSSKVMELVEKVNKSDKEIPNIEYLVRGLNDEDKKKVLNGNYNERIFLSVVSDSSNEILQDYIDNNHKALYKYKNMDVMRLADRGISFPPEILKQKDFFEKIKNPDMVKFRRNINTLYRNSYNPVIANKVKKYEEDILNDFNPETGIFNSYNLNDIDNIKKQLSSKDSFIVDPNVRMQLNKFIGNKRNLDAKKNFYNEQIKSKLNLNLTVDDLNSIQINNITDDNIIKNILNRVKSDIDKENIEFNEEYSNTNANLREISNSKFSEVFIDSIFGDTKKNVRINISEMLRYNKKLSENERILDDEKTQIYSKINNIDKLSSKEKFELYNQLKDKDMVSTLYNDFSNLKKKSYEDINNALYKTSLKPEDISLNDTAQTGSEVYKLKGTPFYMLVRALDTPIHKETMNEQSCYSLISGTNTNTFNDGYANYIYGYDSFNPDMVENIFESDSYTFSSDKNITTRPNRIMTKEEITESSTSYSEINIKNKKSDRTNSRKYDEMRPSYIVAMDKYTKEQIEESKRLGVPIVVIERERYKNKKINDIEYEEYDHDIN